MEKKKEKQSTQKSIEKTVAMLTKQRAAPKPAFIFLVLFYLVVSVPVNILSRSHMVIHTGLGDIPIQSLVGVMSSLSNICMILLAVMYRKPGFITALCILVAQFPVFIITVIKAHTISSIPGFFNNIITIMAITLLHMNNVKIEKYQERIREQAVTDLLTGLPNRFACRELVRDLISRGEKFAFVSVDLNNFKNVNDTMGHQTGNELLCFIASRWKTAANNGGTGTLDFISRQGGDEFAIIIRKYVDDEEVKKTIAFYQSLLENRITIDNCDYFMTASFGYVFYPQDADSIDTLLSYADTAMYEIKRKNSSGHRILRFTPDILKIEQTLEIERKIRMALEQNTIFFNLQPQYDINHKLRGFEALARMWDSGGNVISPGEFIPVAEKVGLIDKVDSAVFRNAANFFGELIKRTGSNATLSVNVSVRHMMKNDFLDEVRDILKNCGVPAAQLEIEITESIMIDSAEKALACIDELKAMGFKIAIDDFGTGYSSLSYLNKFPADLLKVDKSFIDKMNASDSSKQYVAAIISMGHIMGFDVISEGVEHEDQLATLKEIGCDYIQGFIWGKPLSPEDAAKVVEESVAQ